MRRLSDRFAEAAGSCTDLPQLGTLLDDAARELGFHYFALLDHASLDRRPAPDLVRIDNYPEPWARRTAGARLCRSTIRCISPAGARIPASAGRARLTDRARAPPPQILARSRHLGLGGGFTVPANVPGEPGASCSFAVRAGAEIPVAASALRRAGRGSCASRRAAAAHSASGRPRPRLSRREIECLRLVAMGKTDWEIARILGLSIETARQYVKRARAAYDSVSRTQLVVYGLRDAWISFEDAIPPHG